VAILLALLSAALYGAADFLGGMATRRARVAPVVTVAQGSGFVLLAVMLPVLPAASPTSSDLVWGSAAGLAGGIGVALLYWGLAVGSMAIVAPVSAICAVVIPVVAALMFGERLELLTMIGMTVALIAIMLVSQQTEDPVVAGGEDPQDCPVPRRRRLRRPPGLGIALASGVAVGIFFLCLAQTHTTAGMWPLLVARATSTVLFGVGAAVARISFAWPYRVIAPAVVGGAIDMAANAAYILAARSGALSVVVTLVSMYPASTVVLSRVVLGERFSIVQTVGIVLALIAVLMIVRGSGVV
jgi:uncharacterized membrane protein